MEKIETNPEKNAMGTPVTTTADLPEYENPPVIEVACGILFKTLDAFKLPHFGLFWERCKANYPACQEVPPLLPLIERFGDQEETTTISFPEIPLPRVWFLNAEDTGIIQLQRDRFLHNWKKGKPTEIYPRYHTVIELFRRQLQLFEEFLKDHSLGVVHPLQYEMPYVNHIPIDEGSYDLSDPGRVFRDYQWQRTGARFLRGIEHLQLRNSFELPDRKGRLHVSIRDTKSKDFSKQVFLFELTVRGFPSDSSREEMWKWFDMAREWIVRGFTDLTTEEAQKTLWRRTR